MNFDVEADWIINMLCNYNCQYCTSRSDEENDKVLLYTPEWYAKFFKQTGKTWMLHISGGEPFVWNKAVDVMIALSQDHYLSFNTNGTQSLRLARFAHEVNPSRVEYFHIGTHFEERTRNDGWSELYSNMRMLKKWGFTVFASLVMERSAFQHFRTVSRIMWEETGCVLVPKTEMHLTDSDSYTLPEKDQLEHFVWEILDKHPELLKHYTINPLRDIDYLSGFPDFRGHLCRAGVKFVKIDEFGGIWRCQKKEKLGDIGEYWLNLHDTPYTCQEQFCPYYCLKHSFKTNPGR
jgi:organic radical activating enzyme